MRYLISGATGNIGGRVVERLLALGVRPRLLVRDLEKARARFGSDVELLQGDLADEATLRRALADVEGLFLLNSGPELAQRDALAARAAERAGTKRIVKLSALGARASGPATAVALWHTRGEQSIRASGVPACFVQSTGFMSNALAWARSIRAEGVVRASTGDGQIAMIHPDDIADVCVEALMRGGYDGQSLRITGPAALSYAEMTGTIGAAIGRELRFESISDAEARANLLAHGLEPALTDALIELWTEVRMGQVALVTGEVERVTGHAARSFAHWAHEHAQAFR